MINGAQPDPGAKIEVDGKEVGEITSSKQLPTESGTEVVALGYVRKEAAEPGKNVQVSGSPAVVVRPPFKEALTPA